MQICSSIRVFSLQQHVLQYWPITVVYSGPLESLPNQLCEGRYHADFVTRINTINAWAIFESFHQYCRPDWNSIDRSIIHASHLGGDTPITNTLLHEVGHHHLFQVQGIPYDDHLNDKVDRQIDRMARGWAKVVRPLTAIQDVGSVIRALDILKRQQ